LAKIVFLVPGLELIYKDVDCAEEAQALYHNVSNIQEHEEGFSACLALAAIYEFSVSHLESQVMT
jgi:hypothetical protein